MLLMKIGLLVLWELQERPKVRGIILNMVKMFFSSTSLGSVTNLSRLDLLLYLKTVYFELVLMVFFYSNLLQNPE